VDVLAHSPILSYFAAERRGIKPYLIKKHALKCISSSSILEFSR
jgi:hypothetical protein